MKNRENLFVDECNLTNNTSELTQEERKQPRFTHSRWRKEENNNRKISQITRLQKTDDPIKSTR